MHRRFIRLGDVRQAAGCNRGFVV